MMVHVECLPDETMVLQLGGTRKRVTHHTSKARVFNHLKKVSAHFALVDEDPGSAKTSYEKNLKLVEEKSGVKVLKDAANNCVCILKGKLEDWLIRVCKNAGIDIETYNLPSRPNELHRVIIERVHSLKRLLQDLLEQKNADILYLKNQLGL